MYATGGFIHNTGEYVQAMLPDGARTMRFAAPTMMCKTPFKPEWQNDPWRPEVNPVDDDGPDQGCGYEAFQREQKSKPPWLRSNACLLVCNCRRCQRMRPVCH